MSIFLRKNVEFIKGTYSGKKGYVEDKVGENYYVYLKTAGYILIKIRQAKEYIKLSSE
jgi:hypothetical protein